MSNFDGNEIFDDVEKKEKSKDQVRKGASFPSPLNEAAFHGIAGEFVKIIEPHTEADPVALLVNLLTGFGNIIGDHAYFKVEAAIHPMRVFTILVGESSRGRKGTSWEYIKKALSAIDDTLKVSSGLSSGEGLIYAVRDEVTKQQLDKATRQTELVVDDEGVLDKRLLVIEQEFASILKILNREGNILSAIIRSAWDTGDLQTLTKNSPTKATGSHISIIGHITKDELLRYLTSTESSNGFGNRFLWVCVKRSKELPSGGNLKSGDLDDVVVKIKQAVEFAQGLNNEVKWTPKTRVLWAKIYHDLTAEVPGIVGSLTSRTEAYVCRLACIYALLDQSKEIRTEHLKAALAVWDYVYASVRYIFQGQTGDPLSNRILEALALNTNGMTRTEISSLFGRNINSGQLSLSLENLLKLQTIKSEITSTAGRSKELFSLNSFNSYTQAPKTFLEIFEKYISECSTQDEESIPQSYEINEFNELAREDETTIERTPSSIESTPQQTFPCNVCGGRELWKAIWGNTLCFKCHPPANEKSVAEWITL